jgi:hypothetical protein
MAFAGRSRRGISARARVSIVVQACATRAHGRSRIDASLYTRLQVGALEVGSLSPRRPMECLIATSIPDLLPGEGGQFDGSDLLRIRQGHDRAASPGQALVVPSVWSSSGWRRGGRAQVCAFGLIPSRGAFRRATHAVLRGRQPSPRRRQKVLLKRLLRTHPSKRLQWEVIPVHRAAAVTVLKYNQNRPR